MGLFQAKSIKAAVLSTKIAVLESQGKKPEAKDEEKIAEYGKEQEEIKKEAETKHHEAEVHLTRHKLLAGGVTLLQIAIAIGAISALTKRKVFWGVSLCFGLVGVVLPPARTPLHRPSRLSRAVAGFTKPGPPGLAFQVGRVTIRAVTDGRIERPRAEHLP
ncbi:MAG: DUF4337 family protein [Chthoniobacter sp.]